MTATERTAAPGPGTRPSGGADAAFDACVSMDGGVLTLTVSGRIQPAVLGVLRSAKDGVRAGVRRVRLELSGVPHLDAAAVVFLAEWCERCRELGIPLDLAGLGEHHRHRLALAGMSCAAG
ncbi:MULTISPECIES: STAS domain-containing protein [Streptomycetaceae]|uniref:STAS domain-containing protein n=1 Tax=Streptantibioticus cattleyicolor (strain ATCC 35852 / DSM 46488 / JCM 4925 / NBRC 14057 / NRRL 8057) TaxID=1003195 RepID=F8K1S8_STREN|nr:MULTISPECIES: STAS domain-containing protein [Streptomycetaceae]AEW92396.1 hypothetical protein SCATT_00250 [Streptantibioticus cattleyicolor NRRL 8057 = DSM 46488]MYS57208.1 STAS domain-containing protein [Streptomyces sp. SID5468]CCB72762.1 protein of unknown function [Streptantibioticus cattleyicolor NRRL 8057 = DSM 46488]